MVKGNLRKLRKLRGFFDGTSGNFRERISAEPTKRHFEALPPGNNSTVRKGSGCADPTEFKTADVFIKVADEGPGTVRMGAHWLLRG
jgi:hypothetical protein